MINPFKIKTGLIHQRLFQVIQIPYLRTLTWQKKDETADLIIVVKVRPFVCYGIEITIKTQADNYSNAICR